MADHPDQEKLPPSFRVVPSQSRPGQVSYLDTRNNKKYMTVQQCWDIHNETLAQSSNEIQRGGSMAPRGEMKAATYSLGPKAPAPKVRPPGATDTPATRAPSQQQLKHIQNVLATPDATLKAGSGFFHVKY